DDGRGIDIEKIKQKALEMRLLTFDEIENIDEDELLNLIFYPGFSTEKFVTELSGRGLGLDIVNNKIKQLQGKIDVFSKLKEGTLVRLTLPATIATKKVFVIQDKNQLWGIETSVIKTIVRIGIKEIQEKGAYNYYIYNNIPIKIYALSKILNFENDTDEEKLKTKYTLMILELNNEVFGIIVEKVISDQEIILKRLEAPLYHVDNILGITTLANGKPCLILNITEIASLLNSKKQIEKIVTKNQIETTKKNSEYNIMIVDDVKVTRILQKNILTSQGFNTQIYASPALALKKLRQEKFHLVVTDINMPEMNGFEFVEQLRRLKEYKNCPVLVLSSDDINLHQAQIQEFDLAYIQKRDFNQHIFIDTVNKLLSS
ncbi:response regulator, partial [bacterium]|nr:response regulator [bacterium]